MTREEMIDAVIRNRGFEDKYTVRFCQMCEEVENDHAVFAAFIAITTGLIDEDEDEEEA